MAAKSSNNYLVGSEVAITGCRPNNTKVVSSGPQRYTCSSNRQWTPSPDKSLCGYGWCYWIGLILLLEW